MSEQVGQRGLLRAFQLEAPYLARTVPQLPRLIHQALAREPAGDLQGQLQRLVAAQKQQSRWLAAIALLLAALIALSFY